MRIPGKPGKPPRLPKVSKGAPPRPPKLPHRPAPASARVIHHPSDAVLAQQLAVQVTSNGWPQRGVSPFQRARLGATSREGSLVKPTLGSVLHYTPDSSGWMAQLSSDDGTIWAEPVIGWAVVVCWTGYDSEDAEERAKYGEHFETRLEPMIFDGSEARTRLDLGDVTFERLIRPGHLPPVMVPAQPDEDPEA